MTMPQKSQSITSATFHSLEENHEVQPRIKGRKLVSILGKDTQTYFKTITRTFSHCILMPVIFQLLEFEVLSTSELEHI